MAVAAVPLHAHGTSGYEAFFAHPDELFYSLSLARPLLADDLGKRVAASSPSGRRKPRRMSKPYRSRRAARPRERYDVPEAVRLKGPFPARSPVRRVRPLASRTHLRPRGEGALGRQSVKRVGPVLAKDYTFDTKKSHQKDEAERLTGDLAGLIGFVRLARSPAVRDREAEKAGLARLRQVLELRVNLDRVNPRVLEPTDSTTAKLHARSWPGTAGWCRRWGRHGKAHRRGGGAATGRIPRVPARLVAGGRRPADRRRELL